MGAQPEVDFDDASDGHGRGRSHLSGPCFSRPLHESESSAPRRPCSEATTTEGPPRLSSSSSSETSSEVWKFWTDPVALPSWACGAVPGFRGFVGDAPAHGDHVVKVGKRVPRNKEEEECSKASDALY